MNVRLIVGRFLAIVIALAGVMKIYQTIVETFVPGYVHVFHQHSMDFHVGLFMLSVGVTAIWSIRRP